ncbi:response regulator transcription factor [Actinoallomurus vinaceus]|uniref:Response regulator transcription factor n=1 Tax=Actinoallomurus vinaceus TaxID=1080074 RepID=A0ABP8UIB7_9ACTN
MEDDHGVRDVLARGLREEGFRVTTAVDGASALRTIEGGADAVVLDVGLPDSDGRDVCQAMRARGLDVPVLFLTAYDGVTNRLSGFSAGGDDYLVKPFHIAELVARLRAVLRRAGGDTSLRTADLRLDPATHDLSLAGRSIALSPTEFRILGCLMAAAGAVVPRRALLRAGWPEGAIVTPNTLDQYVAKLRRKLRELGSERRIGTVRGVGYRLQ